MDTRQRTVLVYPVVYPNDVTLILLFISGIGVSSEYGEGDRVGVFIRTYE